MGGGNQRRGGSFEKGRINTLCEPCLLSIKNVIDTFKVYSLFPGLNTSLSKCEIAGLGSMKVLEGVCRLKSINLTTYNVKIFGVHFSYNRTLKLQINFLDAVKSIQQVLRFWNSRMLLLEGRIIIFKTLAISKIAYLTFMTVIPNSVREELQKIPKRLYGTPQVQKLVKKHCVTTLTKTC